VQVMPHHEVLCRSGRVPLWPCQMLKDYIQPVAVKAGLSKLAGTAFGTRWVRWGKKQHRVGGPRHQGSLQILRLKVRGSGFRLRAPASLTPASRLNLAGVTGFEPA
jgi:hypothetical protein